MENASESALPVVLPPLPDAEIARLALRFRRANGPVMAVMRAFLVIGYP